MEGFPAGATGWWWDISAPEAQVGGPIGLVRDGDLITIDAEKKKSGS